MFGEDGVKEILSRDVRSIRKTYTSWGKEEGNVQCCGSGSIGSVRVWAFRIRFCYSEVRGSGSIRNLLSSSKISKKNLDSYSFVTFYDFLSLKIMKMHLQKVISKAKSNNFFVILKVNNENSRVRSRIRNRQ